MKRRSRGSIEIFTLSFLDIISSAFAAVVLLVLLSKPMSDSGSINTAETEELLRAVMAAQGSVSKATQELNEKRNELARLKQINAQIQSSELKNKQSLTNANKELERLQSELTGLSIVHTSIQNAAIRARSSIKRDVEVGGIPVDSDYIIFIVDTSGSMQSIWPRVSKEVINVLKIHPRVKGFQIMNDNGIHLISSYSGQWINDTPQRRQSVMNVFDVWKSASNSSPVEGIEVALKRYAKANISLSIYIFGDDYSGSSYDDVIQTIDEMNSNKSTGKRLAKIHAVGFISNYTTNRFSILMREVTKRNGGTFLALPQ